MSGLPFSPFVIQVNGESVDVEAPQTLADLIVSRGLAGKRIAIERNGEIVPKSQHAGQTLQAGDRLEIVIAVGGG